MLDFESSGPGSIPGRGKCDLDFFSFPITFGGQCGGGSLGAWWAKQVLGCHSELHDICIGMNAYKCLVIGRRDVAVRYMIHFYCLAVEAGFYSDVVECWTLNPADRVLSPVKENVIWIFSPFLLQLQNRGRVLDFICPKIPYYIVGEQGASCIILHSPATRYTTITINHKTIHPWC